MSLPKNENQDKTKSQPAMRANDHTASSSRCAMLTGVGRSAIAVIAVTGPHAADAINRCFTPASNRPYSAGEIRYGIWHGGEADNQTTSESVVLTRPGDELFEVHCHGGIAAVERIMDDLRQAGIEPAEQISPPISGFNGKPSLLISEAEQVLTRCVTVRTAAIALDQVRGAMRDWAEMWLSRLSMGDLRGGEAPAEPLHREVRELLKVAELGMRLADPQRVVLVGPPNVGKSSLINAIVGYDRSITFDLPGTTRDVLHTDTVIDGLPIRLSDTAGMRTSTEPIESEGIARAKTAALEADLVVWVTEPGQTETPADADAAEGKRLHVLNKADLLSGSDPAPPNLIKTIATSGAGVTALMTEIANSLAANFPKPGSPVPLNRRQTNLLQRIATAENEPQILHALHELIG